MLTGAHVIERKLIPGSAAAGQRVSAIHWPPECVIASIKRGRRLIVPSGETKLEVGDILTFVTDPEVEPTLDALLAAPHRNNPH
jgi:CIC family chloride channel protein